MTLLLMIAGLALAQDDPTFEETLKELGDPRETRPELGRSYLAAVGRLGFGS